MHGWVGERTIDQHTIRWRFLFFQKPIDEEELRGITVFAHGKLAQRPFFFNLAGGLAGQHGLEYLSGQVVADFLDELDADLIATERQRINWEHPLSDKLLVWGQKRIQELLKVWKERRAEAKVKLLTEKLAPFATRLARLPKHERRIIEGALKKLAGVSSIEEDDFITLGDSLLLAWKGAGCET